MPIDVLYVIRKNFQFVFYSFPKMDQASIVAKIVKVCLQGPDFSALKKELRSHEFVRLYWEVVRGLRETPTDSNRANVKKILFVNERSVIVQDVELSADCTRFETHKILLQDWEKCFESWLTDPDDILGMRFCWNDGIEMYRD